jgi:hypothetical protein
MRRSRFLVALVALVVVATVGLPERTEGGKTFGKAVGKRLRPPPVWVPPAWIPSEPPAAPRKTPLFLCPSDTVDQAVGGVMIGPDPISESWHLIWKFALEYRLRTGRWPEGFPPQIPPRPIVPPPAFPWWFIHDDGNLWVKGVEDLVWWVYLYELDLWFIYDEAEDDLHVLWPDPNGPYKLSAATSSGSDGS